MSLPCCLWCTLYRRHFPGSSLSSNWPPDCSASPWRLAACCSSLSSQPASWPGPCRRGRWWGRRGRRPPGPGSGIFPRSSCQSLREMLRVKLYNHKEIFYIADSKLRHEADKISISLLPGLLCPGNSFKIFFLTIKNFCEKKFPKVSSEREKWRRDR